MHFTQSPLLNTKSNSMHLFFLFGHLEAAVCGDITTCRSIVPSMQIDRASLCSCPTDQTGRGGAGVSDVGAAVRQVIVSGAAWRPQPGRTQQLPAAGKRQPGSHAHSPSFHTHGFHCYIHRVNTTGAHGLIMAPNYIMIRSDVSTLCVFIRLTSPQTSTNQDLIQSRLDKRGGANQLHAHNWNSKLVI